MLATLILFSIGQSTSIDFEARAARLPVFLAELSKHIGEPLECSPNLASQVVLARFKGVRPEQALRRVALVVDGEWQTVNGRKVLTRSSAMQRALEGKWRRRQAQWIAEAMKPGQRALEESPKFDRSTARALLRDIAANERQSAAQEKWDIQTTAKLYDLHARGPEGRAMTRLLYQLGPDVLAALPVGRTVFTLRPNRYQRQLPRSVTEIVRSLRAEQDIWDQELEANPIPMGENGFLRTDPRMSSMGQGSIENVLLIANRHNPRSNISFDFAGYGADRNVVFSAHANLIPGFHFANRDQIQKLQIAGGWAELSPIALTLLRLVALDYANKERAAPEVVAIVRDPVKFEPLSFAPSELILAHAAQRGKNLVAALNDSLEIPALTTTDPDKTNASAFVTLNILRSNIDVEDSSDWMLIKPSSKGGEPLLPDDRFACHELLASALSLGYFTVETLSEFANKSENNGNGLAFTMARILLPRSERILQEADWEALRVYDGLSRSQRNSLARGEAVSISTLSPKAKETLLDTTLRTGFQSFKNGLFVGAMRLDTLPEKWEYEPTNMFGAGIPNGAITIQAVVNSDLLIGTSNAKYVAWTRFASPEVFGQQIRRGSNVFSADDDLWPGTTHTMNLRFGFGNDLALKLELIEHRYDLRKKPLKIKELPADIQRRIGG